MNKKGEMVLRDVIFLIIIFSGILALSGILVQEMGDTYNNTNMTSSYNQDSLGRDQLNETATKWEEISEGLNGNLLQMIGAVLTGAVEILQEVLFSPVTFSNMIKSVLESFGVSTSLTNIIGFIIAAVLYVLIIFVIISAFLKGGRL